MKKEKLLKSILTMVVSLAVIATMSGKAFALTSDSINMDDLTGTESGTSTGTGTGTSTGTNTNKNTNYNTNLPKAGLAENTVFGVAMVALAVVAVYAYRKVKYYKNI